MSTAAHADPAADIIIDWANKMAGVVDGFSGKAREANMTGLTTAAKERLAKMSCKTDEEAKRTENLVKSWKSSKKLPIEINYHAGCDLKKQTMNIEFSITFIKDSAQDTKDDGANAAKVASAVATWGEAMRKAVDELHDQSKLKAQIDATTEAAVRRFADIPCRHSADLSIAELVEKEVGKRSLDIDYTASGRCDEQKHVWNADFKVKRFTVAFDPKKDAKDVSFSTELLADDVVGRIFSDAKAALPQAIGWPLYTEQTRTFHQKVDAAVDRLKGVKCNGTPPDKSAGYVQELIKTKAKEASEYIAVSAVRVTCSGGHMAVEMAYEPVRPKVAPTIPVK